jgi:LacI family transcriptional regulator
MPTILDVAKRAGVSKSVVSLVINDASGVSQKSRAKVLTAIRELNYIPNRAAREMVTAKSGNIGLLAVVEDPVASECYSTKNIVDSFSQDICIGVEKAIQNIPYGVLFARCNGKLNEGLGLPKMIRERWIDGLIIAGGAYEDAFLKAIETYAIPTVLTGSKYYSEKTGCVFADTQKGAYKAVKHLIGLGHSELAFINSTAVSQNSFDKLNGYKEALYEAKIPFREPLVRSSSFSAYEGYLNMQELLALQNRPTAVFCAFDGIAIGAMRAIKESGLKIPQDIAVIGFEDSWLASHADPPLSTIRINKEYIGEIMTKRLMEMLEGELSQGFKMLLEPELIVRQSCGGAK